MFFSNLFMEIILNFLKGFKLIWNTTIRTPPPAAKGGLLGFRFKAWI
jgi:hypothetical protein